MNISGLIGLVIAFGLIIYGIMSGGEISNFIDPASIYIVVGGTIGAVIFNYPVSILKNVPKMLKIAFLPTKYDPDRKSVV